jgi:carbon-monoxide dehydrogenase small subunit
LNGRGKEVDMFHEITITINDESMTLAVKSHHTLLKVLREQIGLTGTKIGCENGECGACTVLMDGEPVNACMVLAVETDGHSIETVENLNKSGELHPLQKAFVKNNAIQCGFCTPGMLMMAKGYLAKIPIPLRKRYARL